MADEIVFEEQDLDTIDTALEQLDQVFSALASIDTKTRRRLFKMGNKSEKFCRETLTVMDQNRQLVPPAMDLNRALDALATIDALRPRTAQIIRLAERLQDTEMLLGAEVATAARKGYRSLKEYGDVHGLTSMRNELGARFKRRSSRKAGAAGEEGQAA